MDAQSRAKEMKRLLKRMRDLRDANYPPSMTGPPGTDFAGDGNETKSLAIDQLADSMFGGITPSPKTLPFGDDYLDWIIDLNDAAKAVVDSPSPTSAELQDAADNYQTVASQMADVVSAYT